MNNKHHTYTLVTGAGSGIGLAVCEELSKRGKHCLMVALPNESVHDKAALLSKKYGTHTAALECDLTLNEGIEQLFDWLSKDDLSVDCFINNAGIGYTAPLAEVNPQLLEKLLLLNVVASTKITRHLLPKMLLLPKAQLVFIASMAALQPTPQKAAYAASKAYLINFGRSLRSELHDSSVGVTVICPGGVYTNPAVKRRIEAAGKMGKLTAQSAEDAAMEIVSAAERNKEMHITGGWNRALYKLTLILPNSIKQKKMRRQFEQMKDEKGEA